MSGIRTHSLPKARRHRGKGRVALNLRDMGSRFLQTSTS
ncbi:hypothetical protein FOXG_19828 [Fusarium oxysporum f. sp. lycopersici 4287]|uniref:Uncharacterized protein n=2 Tax=Fusarium oxysporum TaxID=5507 RepID=A0A0J9V864_FUSO4|nr:hypothetical protein FOXG_19828 [Fusarium oxysporum f. sp. lycopersici 4287]EXK32221.1 hypothetical protein FOMG_12493 [Fusarium oxysporum f. sp. melonis 26406]KNB07345.1 hypothetical protein FOXG_19828 [Fusarium oxysporum f. sp. lycopersici 4287]